MTGTLQKNRTSPLYGIIGDGRIARHFSYYFNELGVPFRTWSRRKAAKSGESLSDALGECDHILVLIRDSAILPLLQEPSLRPLFQTKIVTHFSGALSTPLAESAHPLMTFGYDLYERSFYSKIPFVLEKGRRSFQELFPSLPNPSYVIPPELKPYYHALCVMSGNFTTLLWQKFFKTLEAKFEIPKEAALPFLQKVAGHLFTDPERALTGPFSRGDEETIRRNLQSLSSEQDPYEKIYQSFTDLFRENKL